MRDKQKSSALAERAVLMRHVTAEGDLVITVQA